MLVLRPDFLDLPGQLLMAVGCFVFFLKQTFLINAIYMISLTSTIIIYRRIVLISSSWVNIFRGAREPGVVRFRTQWMHTVHPTY